MNEYPQQKLKREWVQEGIVDDTVNWAKSFGRFLQSRENNSDPLTTSQIRKFYGELKRVQTSKNKEDIPLLKAKLAYAVGRDLTGGYGTNQPRNQTKIKEFYEELEKGIDAIQQNDEKQLRNFVKIVESIVAYHKYHGGK